MSDRTLNGEGDRTLVASLRRALAPLAGVAGCLLLAAVIIDPFREMLSLDDGWAYARSVEQLLRTGEYRLDAWSAANTPVQTYLAAGLSKIFGYSLSLLRLSTAAMLAVGLASFYGLARELGAARPTSFAATLALLASPLVLLLSFTFMSDIQFLGWMLAALFLYVRGLRRGNDAVVLLGSMAAAAAIGTRQFGVAIVGGLLIAWILCRRADRPRLRTMLLAVALPAVAASWQILLGLQEPNFTQVVRLHEQGAYLGQPDLLAHEFLWRGAIVLQYMGISILPALPLLVGAALGLARGSRRAAVRFALLAALIGLSLCAILLTGSPLTAALARPARWPWPPLGLEWLLPTQLTEHAELFPPLDLAGLGAGAALSAVALFSAQRLWPVRRHRPETILLVVSPACLLGLHLIYVQLNDTYIGSFVPFALLLLAVQYRESSLGSRAAVVSMGVSLATLLFLSLWIRADFAAQTTLWSAADRLMKAGVPAAEIYGERHWMEYHGAFDDWLAAGHTGYELRPLTRPRLYLLHGPFYAWLEIRGQHAAYRVQNYPMSEPGWRLIARDFYRDFEFKRHEVFTYQAVDATKVFK